MAGLAIRSAGEMFAFMALAGDDETLWNALDLEKFQLVIPVSIHGSRRDGRLDKAGAKFIRDLQRQTYDAFRAYGGIPTGGRKNWLRTAVDEGSDRLEVDFTEIIKEALRKMTPSQIVGTVCFCALLATGYSVYGRYTDADIEVVKAQIDAHARVQQNLHVERLLQLAARPNDLIQEDAKTVAAGVAEEAAAKGKDAYRPVRKLVKSMGRGETVSAGAGPELPKIEALERLGPMPDPEMMFHVHGDGSYSLRGLDLNDGPPGLRIAQDDIETTAILERLDPELKASILDTADESMESRSRANMDLQVDVYFTLSKIKYAVVVGVGRPRGDMVHYGFADIPKEVHAGDLMRQGESDDSPSPSM